MEDTAMDRKEAIGWVLTVCASLRRSQAKTLAELVVASLRVGRVNLPAIAAGMGPTTTLKHAIKRAWRFTCNRQVEISVAMRGVIARLTHRRREPLVVALDWVEIRAFHTLAAVAVLPGRSVPLLWASYPEWVLYKSQNNLEEGLLRLLRTLVPKSVPIILLADRGFGRTELARVCQALGLHYIVRITPDVYVQCARYRGKLLDYPVKRGIRRVLKDVAYRRQQPVTQHVAVLWQRGLPKRRDEPWFLMTDLDWPATTLAQLYGRRMTIEEMFRDHKSRRNGFALRHTRVKHPDRFDRLLLILALAYILLTGLGHYVQERYCPSNWCSNTRRSECSVFTIGRRMLDRLQVPIRQALQALTRASMLPLPNWG
jgi:hypothetical protein